ncbi:hypothetical protein SD960_20885 [Flavobacterium sp. MMLR14_040]|uniref:hypothetical protein n=1 Tax=Flavobacterium sp. MMLR14_040 TaxID=3093843 RepID=UPI0029900F25|nr:hypothetical protein [Flavobacterium sp. MMLR14_040]MDW8852570.1 hypothetical protein [Flavobacterium sp. MMLR14_040]
MTLLKSNSFPIFNNLWFIIMTNKQEKRVFIFSFAHAYSDPDDYDSLSYNQSGEKDDLK